MTEEECKRAEKAILDNFEEDMSPKRLKRYLEIEHEIDELHAELQRIKDKCAHIEYKSQMCRDYTRNPNGDKFVIVDCLQCGSRMNFYESSPMYTFYKTQEMQ